MNNVMKTLLLALTVIGLSSGAQAQVNAGLTNAVTAATEGAIANINAALPIVAGIMALIISIAVVRVVIKKFSK